MLRNWKYAEQETSSMCELKDKVLSRRTPKLFTEEETEVIDSNREPISSR